MLDSFDGFIFDLDGTLIDSSNAWHSVDVNFMSRHNLNVPDDYDKEIAGLGFDRAAKYTIDRFSLDRTVESVMAEWNELIKEVFASEVFLFDKASDFLRKLKLNGKKLTVATVNNLDLTESVLKNNGVLDLFDDIVTVHQVSRPKGFPDIYLKAAEKMNLPVEKCVVFEDILEGIKGAKDGGFKTVAVLCKEKCYNKDDIISLSDKYINGYGELI